MVLLSLIFTYNVSMAMEEFSLRYSFHISGKYIAFLNLFICLFYCAFFGRLCYQINRLEFSVSFVRFRGEDKIIFKVVIFVLCGGLKLNLFKCKIGWIILFFHIAPKNCVHFFWVLGIL